MEENLKKLSGHLNDYLVHGYPINEKRLGQKQLEVLTLKEDIRILSRAMEEKWENHIQCG